MLSSENFFSLEDWEYGDLFDGCDKVWEVLPKIKDYVRRKLNPNVSEIRREFGSTVEKTCVIWEGRLLFEGFELKLGDVTKKKFVVSNGQGVMEGAIVVFAGSSLMDDDIELKPGAVVEPGALIKGPTIIGEYTDVRQGAYLRGSCLIGEQCVVGHTTEVKNSVMLPEAKAGHFAYIGDSVLGRNCNLGAGTKLANLKIRGREVFVSIGSERIGTGLRKFGAILGDYVETGCNSVTNPGTVIGPKSLVCPCITVKPGYYPRGSVIR